jgi:hypothetical protein
MSLFDDRDMAGITSPEFPGERLIVCRNRALAAERARKREDLLAATERDLARIAAAVARKRQPLRGKAEIGLEIGAVLDKHKMAKHFALDITDTSFDCRLADRQPVECAIELVLVDHPESELLAEAGGRGVRRQRPGGGKFGTGIAVRSPNSATAVTANGANCKSPMACSAPLTAVRWQSKSSRAAPQIRRP